MSAQLFFDRQAFLQNHLRGEGCFEEDGLVEEVGLVGIAPGGGLVER